MNSKILVIIPALNEERAIVNTIEDIKYHVKDCDIVVLDGHSEDKTAELAIQHQANVLTVPRGKANAFKVAVRILDKQYEDSKYWIMLDADFTYPAKYIRSLSYVLGTGVDVAVGYRKYMEKGAMSKLNQIGNWGLSYIAKILYGGNIKDVCTGLWAFKKEVVTKYDLKGNGFALEADLYVNTMSNGYSLEQIPIYYRARKEGDQSKLAIIDGFKIGWFLIKSKYE